MPIQASNNVSHGLRPEILLSSKVPQELVKAKLLPILLLKQSGMVKACIVQPNRGQHSLSCLARIGQHFRFPDPAAAKPSFWTVDEFLTFYGSTLINLPRAWHEEDWSWEDAYWTNPMVAEQLIADLLAA
jgi:hypothetical protein